MASIFSYEPDPPRVTSPWPASFSQSARQDTDDEGRFPNGLRPTSLTDAAITRLDAEPQEGPTEYKLHLLLRPRRSYSSVSTGHSISGSQQHIRSPSLILRSSSESNLGATPPPTQSLASKQHRLEQLTTQLLWRLQQSSPYHSSSANNVILPALPDNARELEGPQQPAKLVPGLEESKGALYEIGISDDGTFVGLTMDELNESLQNLRAMAASLGCSVEVRRLVRVGDCEWYEEDYTASDRKRVTKKSDLYVAEAYVKPELRHSTSESVVISPENGVHPPNAEFASTQSLSLHKNVEQLRVCFTGATTSGKSSLLGTLSTSTLDNGQGKSRLSLLRHRHEIASGVTSSVAQELIGYRDKADDETCGRSMDVLNYASENVSSWGDLHAILGLERLVFLTDSAGHPRFRRTTLRGLLGWAPHWTLLCVAGGEGIDAPEVKEREQADGPVFPGANAHVSMAHLDLCLKLHLPLVVLITKLDMATKSDLRQILSTMLTSLKNAGRRPVVITNSPGDVDETELQYVYEHDLKAVETALQPPGDSFATVPILFTSATSGVGIRRLHALLWRLPIPQSTPSIYRISPGPTDISPTTLFQIDHTFDFTPARNVGLVHDTNRRSSIIVSGYLARGRIAIGDEVFMGPFSEGRRSSREDSDVTPQQSLQNGTFLTSRSFSDALARAITPPSTGLSKKEWRKVRVISIRNLRSPIRALQVDQIGTVGVSDATDVEPLSVRKGMVLTSAAASPPESSYSFTASFNLAEAGTLTVGCLLVVYCKSVRAAAKVVAVALDDEQPTQPGNEPSPASDDDDDFMFALDEEQSMISVDDTTNTSRSVLVTCRFMTYREYIEVGARVLVMPGGGAAIQGGVERGEKGVGSLESFVGVVVQLFG